MEPKRKAVKGFLIKNKRFDTPWTLKMAQTEKGAWEIFDELNERFVFDKNNFEIVPCLITFTISKGNKEK